MFYMLSSQLLKRLRKKTTITYTHFTVHRTKQSQQCLNYLLCERHYSDFFFAPLFPQHLRVQNRHDFRVTHKTVMKTKAKKPITSRLWYWNQFKSCAATLRCGAPLCLITNSDQKTARSKGSTGRSRCILDSPIILSLYLKRRHN